MRLVTDLSELQRGGPAIVTIGAFDGVHRGHQYLIGQVVDRARSLEYDSIVLTFDPRPEVIFRPDALQLASGESKCRYIEALGPDVLCLMPFNGEVAQTPAPQFLVKMLDHINVREIWLGADFAFGHKRQGNVEFLVQAGQQSHFAVHVVPRESLNGTPISSTLARDLVAAGKVAEAARFLGHYFAFSGEVLTGFGRGRQFGFPTANVQPPAHQLLPATGIYAAYAHVGGERHQAAVSVGYNPHFGGERLVVEAYILDFDGDLVGATLELEFVERIRDERKFESLEALLAEIGRDVDTTRSILQEANDPGEPIPG